MNFFSILTCLVFVILSGMTPLLNSLAHCKSSAELEKKPILNKPVMVSFPFLALIIKEVAGPELTISTLTSSEEDIHHLELSPKTLLKLNNQDLLFYNGLGFESAMKVLRQTPEWEKKWSQKMIELSKGVTPLKNEQGQTDPHAWHDPDNLIIYIDNVASALSEHYPQNREFFFQRAKESKEKLTHWKQEKIKLLQKLPKTLLMVTAHDGFRYLAESLKINIICLLNNHDRDTLSPKKLAQKIKTIKEYSHRQFFGDGGSQDIMLKGVAENTQSPWGGLLWGESPPLNTQALLSSLSSEKASPATTSVSLLDYLEHNFTIIYKAFTTTATTTTSSSK